MHKDPGEKRREEIAVIGMAGQFPRSPSLPVFWENLRLGRELIHFFSDEELLNAKIDPLFLQDPSYVKAKGVLEEADCFDADFFGYSTREAECIDPQQRKLLELSVTALETAGYDPDQYAGLIGVFASCSLSSYFYLHLFSHLYGAQGKSPDEMWMVMGNEKDFLASRISYKLNLKGPSQSIQTACSSSLVAVHHACQSLFSYECDIALAGGISITFPLQSGYFYSPEGILSPDGHCRAFDHKAAGTLTGNGGGMVVLKRLSDALADLDTIYAVIKSSCVNNDGADKVGYTAPSVQGQMKAILAAQLSAGISPDTITYVEAHGTGTLLGDPIEFKALTQAFRTRTQARQFCGLGSVKTNIGHLDAAAGIAGFIKTVLALQHKTLPPTLHFERQNPQILLENSPFYIPSQCQPWERPSAGPLCAGISSFGMGGTNAHVILQEAPSLIKPEREQGVYLLPFSAKTAQALKTLVARFIDALPSLPFSLGDIAFTLQVGRKSFAHRICLLCASKEEALSLLQAYLNTGIPPHLPSRSPQLEAVALKWLHGEPVVWTSLHSKARPGSRVPLPTYPFAKPKYCIVPKSLGTNQSPSIIRPAKRLQRESSMPFVPPENKIEEQLIQIWENSLKTAGIGVEDDFFSLGGDSLLALEIAEIVRTRFRVEVHLPQLFNHPTIRNFGSLLKELLTQKIDDLSEEEVALLLELV